MSVYMREGHPLNPGDRSVREHTLNKEQREKLENMAEGPQVRPTRALLKERADECESLAEELDNARDNADKTHEDDDAPDHWQEEMRQCAL